jgi:predicted nucleic acid-binding protein
VSLVLDASTGIAAVLPDEDSAFARAAVAAALDESLVVPTLWMYEVQNGLAMALRRNRIDAISANEALNALRALRAELKPPQGLGQEFRLAYAHALTTYDAAYLAVALGTGATFATNDKRLRRVAEKLGVALFTDA